jgi:hypothetical protein
MLTWNRNGSRSLEKRSLKGRMKTTTKTTRREMARTTRTRHKHCSSAMIYSYYHGPRKLLI